MNKQRQVELNFFQFKIFDETKLAGNALKQKKF